MLTVFFALIVSQLRLGPYMNWEDSTSTTITISWYSVVADSGFIAYGVGSLTDTVWDTVSVIAHSFKLTGLTPRHRYIYKVAGSSYSTPIYSFRTAPLSADTIRFVVYGDNRSDSAAHQMVVDAIAQQDPDFVINTGDMVGHGNDIDDWYEFFAIEADLLHNSPIMPTIGNHDTPSYIYRQFFHLPENERYYTFEYGNVVFIALNTETSDYSSQRTYLQQRLEEITQDSSKWVVVYFHRPPYSAGGHGSDYDVRAAWCDILESYGVPIVFNGHNHFYQRSVPINGVTYIVTGGGGAPLYTPGSASWVAYSASCYHYVLVTVTDTVMSIKAIRATDGAVIDSLEFHKRLQSVEEDIHGLSLPSQKLSPAVFDVTGRVVARDTSSLAKPGVYLWRGKDGTLRKLIIVK